MVLIYYQKVSGRIVNIVYEYKLWLISVHELILFHPMCAHYWKGNGI